MFSIYHKNDIKLIGLIGKHQPEENMKLLAKKLFPNNIVI